MKLDKDLIQKVALIAAFAGLAATVLSGANVINSYWGTLAAVFLGLLGILPQAEAISDYLEGEGVKHSWLRGPIIGMVLAVPIMLLAIVGYGLVMVIWYFTGQL